MDDGLFGLNGLEHRDMLLIGTWSPPHHTQAPSLFVISHKVSVDDYLLTYHDYHQYLLRIIYMFERQQRACWSERLWAWQWPCSLHLSASHLWPCCPGEQTKWYICSVRWDKSVSWKWGFALACVTVRACVHACVCVCLNACMCVCVCMCMCVCGRKADCSLSVWVIMSVLLWV